MKKLYEINNLKENKERLEVVDTENMEKIQLFYMETGAIADIPVSSIKSFNVFTNKEVKIGYVYFYNDIEISNHCSDDSKKGNDVDAVIVSYNDNSKVMYMTHWSSLFYEIERDTYIMLFIAEEI